MISSFIGYLAWSSAASGPSPTSPARSLYVIVNTWDSAGRDLSPKVAEVAVENVFPSWMGKDLPSLGIQEKWAIPPMLNSRQSSSSLLFFTNGAVLPGI
jgi:hypothetical protein